MARDQWTIVLVQGEDGPLRQVTLSRRTLRTAAGGAAFLATVFVALLVTLGMKSAYRIEAGLLEQENRVLTAELEGIRTRMRGLEGDLAFLAERDTEARLLAGLTPIDEEVLRVGVGGPGVSLVGGAGALPGGLHAGEGRVRGGVRPGRHGAAGGALPEQYDGGHRLPAGAGGADGRHPLHPPRRRSPPQWLLPLPSPPHPEPQHAP
jgi:hypothetical protein